MKFDINIITNWKFLLPMVVGLLSLAWSIFNFILGKATASKITNNDLKHLTVDVTKLQDDNKKIKTDFKIENDKIKIDLKGDLKKIYRRLGKIEKIQYAQQKICNERHPKK